MWWQIPYIWKRRADGLYVINLAKTWEKLMLAARIIVAIENPNDGVCRTRVEQAQNGWRRAAVAPGPRASNTLAPGGKSVHGFPAHTLLSALPLCEVGAARASRVVARAAADKGGWWMGGGEHRKQEVHRSEQRGPAGQGNGADDDAVRRLTCTGGAGE